MADSAGGRSGVAAALVLGLFMAFGLGALGHQLGASAIRFKEYERTVTVKGLAEREVPSDVVIWPIGFTVADNDLSALYATLDGHTATIRAFLAEHGIEGEAVSVAPPAITDKVAQQIGGGQRAEFRYLANQRVTVYSEDVAQVRSAIGDLGNLVRSGIVLARKEYGGGTEYLFTGLNEVKPAMIEEATNKAREVALKFAEDSESRLGKIKRARQGQFSINDRDRNNPHIKRVRVVSTVEYYLSD
jgi:hypothetical protein